MIKLFLNDNFQRNITLILRSRILRRIFDLITIRNSWRIPLPYASTIGTFHWKVPIVEAYDLISNAVKHNRNYPDFWWDFLREADGSEIPDSNRIRFPPQNS